MSRRTGADVELAQHLGGRLIDPLIGAEAELQIGLQRIRAGILQLIGAQLVHQADAAAFLREIEQHAAALLRRFSSMAPRS